MSRISTQRRTLLKTGAYALAGGVTAAALGPRTVQFISSAQAATPASAGLDRLQAGHLRHLLNMANRPDGDWSHMMTSEVEQHGLGSFRYQLSHFVYALGLAHYHHLPAAPGYFREPMQRLMTKMLRHDVWRYWYEESRSSPRFDPGLTTPREPWADPVAKENIMYSGHVHAMAGMYDVLFNEDRYEQPKSLTMARNDMWKGREAFEYDLGKLNEVIYRQMKESGWLGIPCEPNMVFIICNQLPLLGLRFHDIRKGTSLAPDTTSEFRKAWQAKGLFGEGGKSITFYQVRQGRLIPGDPGVDAHTGTFMNAWNPGVVQQYFPARIKAGLRRAADGTLSPFPHSVLDRVASARAAGTPVDVIEDRNYRWTNPDLGTIATFLSEMGDRATLDALLAHADKHMQPSWENGGLYYPRNDTNYDAAGNMKWMDPLTGNGLIAYARLNVKNGMAALYNEPWGKEHFARPAVQEVKGSVDLLRANWAANGAVALTAKAISGSTDAEFLVSGVKADRPWSVQRDGVAYASSGKPDAARAAVEGGNLKLRMKVDKATDLVVSV